MADAERAINRQLWIVIIIFAVVNLAIIVGGAIFVGITLDRQDQTLSGLSQASARSDCRSVLTGRADLTFRDNLTAVFVALLDPDPATRSTGFTTAVTKLDKAAPLTQREIDKHCGPAPGR